MAFSSNTVHGSCSDPSDVGKGWTAPCEGEGSSYTLHWGWRLWQASVQQQASSALSGVGILPGTCLRSGCRLRCILRVPTSSWGHTERVGIGMPRSWVNGNPDGASRHVMHVRHVMPLVTIRSLACLSTSLSLSRVRQFWARYSRSPEGTEGKSGGLRAAESSNAVGPSDSQCLLPFPSWLP